MVQRSLVHIMDRRKVITNTTHTTHSRTNATALVRHESQISSRELIHWFNDVIYITPRSPFATVNLYHRLQTTGQSLHADAPSEAFCCSMYQPTYLPTKKLLFRRGGKKQRKSETARGQRVPVKLEEHEKRTHSFRAISLILQLLPIL